MVSENFSENKKNCQLLNNVTILERDTPEMARDVARYGVTTIMREDSIYKAIEIMVEKNISGLPVVDDNNMVGIISEKDVLSLVYSTEFITDSVGNYMTENVISFSEEDSLTDVWECLINNSFRRVPIMRNGKLAGLITRADLIKANKDKFKPQGLPENSLKQQSNSILAKDAMKCGLLTIRPYTPIYEAVEILASKNITGLPVVDDYMNLIGIVSEKDILKLLYDPKVKPGKAEEFMTEEVVSFNQNDSLLDVCDCLINNNFRRVPILDQGRVVGIISRADIIVYILKNKSRFYRQK